MAAKNVRFRPRLCENSIKIGHLGTALDIFAKTARCVSITYHNHAFGSCFVLYFSHRKFRFDVFTQPRPEADLLLLFS